MMIILIIFYLFMMCVYSIIKPRRELKKEIGIKFSLLFSKTDKYIRIKEKSEKFENASYPSYINIR
jgi:hypothetical protein